MKNILLFTIGLLLPYVVFSQGENNIWYFGCKAGLDFNTNPPTVLTYSEMCQSEAVASISDSNGQLLFYTDGATVWDENHIQMPNGTGLGGGISSQQMLILPHPGNTQQYYIFTMCEMTPPDVLNNTFASYSIVDMSLGTNGDVVSSEKNIKLKDESGVSFLSSTFKTEAITAVMHGDGVGYWVLIPVGSNLYSYRIDETGFIEMPIVTELGFNFQRYGHIKASPYLGFTPNYTNFVSISKWHSMYDYDYTIVNEITKVNSFDNNTGKLTGDYFLSLIIYGGNYSTEFNSDGTLLYFGGLIDAELYVIDLLNFEEKIVYEGNPSLFCEGGSLQRAVNNEIYYSILDGDPFLARIDNPDSFLECAIEFDNYNLFIGNYPSAYKLAGLPQLIPMPNEDSCRGSLTLTGEEIHKEIVYQLESTITTTSNYVASDSYGYQNASVVMIAGDMIELLSSTYINNSSFLAKIEDCPNTTSSKSKRREAYAQTNKGYIAPKLDVYPNPANEFINVSATNIVDNVTITDLNGRTVKQVTVGAAEGQINISDLAQGVYILNATSNGKSFTQKIVKQ